MRVLITAKTTPENEAAGPAPGSGSPDLGHEMEAIMQFHRDLVGAGILLATGRLQPSANGARVRFEGSKRSVVDGPFTEAKELIGGFWLWQVRSLDEAIEWLKRAPFQGGEFEVRPVDDTADTASGSSSESAGVAG